MLFFEIIFKIFLLIILIHFNKKNYPKFYLLKGKPYKMKDIQDLTLKEKIGQLLFIGFKEPNLTEEVRNMIREYKIDNFVLFLRNIKNKEQLEQLTRDIHEEVINSTGIMPFIAIDQEGGNNIRIMDKSTFYPGPMTIASTNIDNAKIIGHMMGKHLLSLGINMNFAPSLDVNNNPKNQIICIRSYSDKPEIVSKYGLELIKGMQEEGIIATAKHFPGHGDTEIDTHLDLPVLNFTKERLYNIELKPFKDAIDNGIKSIMAAHIIFREVDKENPATISKDIMKGILRDEFNFKGLIISDCMEMKAISDKITTPIGVAKGLKAGLDFALVCHTKKRQIDSVLKIKEEIDNNVLTVEEIDEKIKRILKYKKEVYDVMKNKFFNNEKNMEVFKDEKISLILQNIVDSSLTFVHGKKLEIKGKTLVYWCQLSATNIAEDIISSNSINNMLNKEIPSIDTIEYKAKKYNKEIIDKSKEYDTVIFLSFNAFKFESQVKMINEINQICSNFFVISMRNPYDYLKIDENINYYTLYESTPNAQRTIVKFLKGEIDANGHLPIDLNHNI